MTLESQGNIPSNQLSFVCVGWGMGGWGVEGESDLAEGTGKVCFFWFNEASLDAYKAIADRNISVFLNPLNYT